MAQNNIGPKRLVVGAHYGLKDFLAQRVTAVGTAAGNIEFPAEADVTVAAFS